MSQFIKELALLLNDRQEFQLTATKVKDDLVLMITPDSKGKGKLKHITIPAEDLLKDETIDSQVLACLSTVEVIEPITLQVSESKAPEPKEDEEEEESKETKVPKIDIKNTPKKKVATKKAAKVVQTKEEAPEADDQKSEPIAEEKAAEDIQDKVEETPIAEVEEVAPIDTPTQEVKAPEPEGPNNKELFTFFMDDAKKHFEDRKWTDAENAYSQAIKLFPEDKNAKEGLRQSSLWVKRIAELQKQD